MASVDSYNNIFPVQMIHPALYNATQTTVLSMTGYESVTFVISTGVITDGTWTIAISDGPAVGGPFTACPLPGATGGNYLILSPLLSDVNYVDTGVPTQFPQTQPGPFTNAGWNNQVFRIGYVGDQPFVQFQLVLTDAGGTGGIFSVVAEQGCPHFAPTPSNYEPANNTE